MIRDPFQAPQNPAATLRHPSGVRAETAGPVPSHVIFEEFLVREELGRLLRFSLEREAKFVETTVRRSERKSSVDRGYRRSRAIFDIGPHFEIFATRVLAFLPYVFAKLHQEPFDVTRIEAQITASNDGDFYRVHRDNSHGVLRSRAITFVFYFYRPPQAFTGGALRIQSDQGNSAMILPQQNEMIVFPSGLLHEILPVSCPSRQFANSRFALTGWIHR